MDHTAPGITNSELLVDPKLEVDIEQSQETVFIGSKVSAVVKVRQPCDIYLLVSRAYLSSEVKLQRNLIIM